MLGKGIAFGKNKNLSQDGEKDILIKNHFHIVKN